VKTEPRSTLSFRPPLAVEPADGRFDPVEIIELDTQHRKLVGRDGMAQQCWQLELPGDTSQWNAVLNGYRYAAAYRRGHLLLLHIGQMLCAFDLFQSPGRPLWVHQLATQTRTAAGVVVFGAFGPLGPGRFSAENGLPMVVGPQAVYVLGDWRLTAIDLLSGEVRWVRDDLEPGGRLFGDEDLLLVLPEDGQEAMVFRTYDGKLLGRCQLPPGRDRLAFCGRNVLTWEDDRTRARLALYDPWAGSVIWEKTFAGGSQPALVDTRRTAVVQPDGRLVILDSPSGRPLVQAELEPEPQIESLGVLGWSQGYLVAVNRPGKQGNLVVTYPYMRQLAVHGRLYGLDHDGGKPLWSRTIEDHAFWLDQPAELPVLVLCNRLQRRDGNRVIYQMKLACLDKRNGRMLYEAEQSRSASNTRSISPTAASPTAAIELLASISEESHLTALAWSPPARVLQGSTSRFTSVTARRAPAGRARLCGVRSAGACRVRNMRRCKKRPAASDGSTPKLA